jgi:hypothetical protein
MPEAFDPVRMLQALVDDGVDFVLIGAFAVAVHAEVRNTADVDIAVPAGDTENRRRLDQALRRLDARRISDLAADAQARREYPTLMFATRYGRLDVLYGPDGAPAYRELRERSITSRIANRDVHVAAVDDLIRMKLAAGREQDLRDIAALTAEAGGVRVEAWFDLSAAADSDAILGYAGERIRYADPDADVWVEGRQLGLRASVGGLDEQQGLQWLESLGARLLALDAVRSRTPADWSVRSAKPPAQ